MVRWFAILFVVLALGYVLLVALLYFTQRHLIYPGAMRAAPLAAPSWGDAVTIETPDGERLAAVHREANEGAPTVLFLHGNADSTAHYGFLADAVGARGVGLLAVSYRGYGGSTGRPSETGLLADGLAAHDWLVAHGSDEVVVLGQSLGTGVAVHVAAEREVRALILVSAYDSLLELARRSYRYVPVGPLLSDHYRSDQRIAGIAVPKLFVHGARDPVIPIARGRALFDAAPEPKRFVELDGFAHNDVWAQELLDIVDSFLAEVLQ